MERIKSLFKNDEKILWYDTIDKGKRRERDYIITNRRIYKKALDIPKEDFSSFPHKFLSVKDDILCIKRIGIEDIKIKRHKSKFQKIKEIIELIKKGKKYFEHIKKEIEEARKKLEEGENPDFSLPPSSSETDLAEAQKKLARQLLMTYNIKIYVKNAMENKAITIYEKLSLPQSTEISNMLKDESTIITDTPTQESQISIAHQYQQPPQYQPYQQQDQYIRQNQGNPLPQQYRYTNLEHTESPSLQESSADFFVQPSESEYLEVDLNQQFSALEEDQASAFQEDIGKSTTSRILEFSNKDLFVGNYCFYCDVELGSYLEKVYYCENCGAYYHQSCLDNLMCQGICLNCNRLLIW